MGLTCWNRRCPR